MTRKTLTPFLALSLALVLVAPAAAQDHPAGQPPYSLIIGRLVAVDVLAPPLAPGGPRVRVVVALEGFRRAVDVRQIRDEADVTSLSEDLGALVTVTAGIERKGGRMVYWTVPAQVEPLQD